MFGVAVLAVIVVEPGPTGVTATVTLFWLIGMDTAKGTVATLLFEEVRLNVTLDGAGEESDSDTFCTGEAATNDNVAGRKLAVPLTCTVALAGVYPNADAEIEALPKSTPITVGAVLGVVCPCGTNTLGDTSATFDVSLLESVIVTPPAGAGVPRVTDNGACWPGGTVTLLARVMAPWTVTLAVESGIFGELLA